MKATRTQPAKQRPQGVNLPPASVEFCPVVEQGIDLALLEDSLRRTPWERMQANDDALRFAESLAAAMRQRDAKS